MKLSRNAWLLASRPKTLPAAAVPVMVGSAVAYGAGGLAWLPALVVLVDALMIQIGTNFANDVFDYEQGADTAERVGPLRAVASGLLSPAAMRRGMVLVFSLSALCGAYLVWVAGWPLVVIGVASIAAGVAYTAGPFPLGYHGLGDLFVMIFFGFVAVCGTVYVQLGVVPALAWWLSVPVGALATAILVVNNLRDRRTDAAAGKRTLAVRLGRQGAVLEYSLLLTAAYAVPLALVVRGAGAALLLPWMSAPLAWRLLRDVRQHEGPQLNPVLARSSLLQLVFGLLLALGVALGGAG